MRRRVPTWQNIHRDAEITRRIERRNQGYWTAHRHVLVEMRKMLQGRLLGAKGRGATTSKRGGVSEASRRMRMQVDESLIVGSDAQDEGAPAQAWGQRAQEIMLITGICGLCAGVFESKRATPVA